MRKLLLGLFVAALAASARANPMLDAGKARQASCAEELARARVHGACDAGDIPTLCAGVKPGGSRTMSCLRKNKKKLNKDCLKALKDYDALANPKPDDGTKKKGRGRAGVAATRC